MNRALFALLSVLLANPGWCSDETLAPPGFHGFSKRDDDGSLVESGPPQFLQAYGLASADDAENYYAAIDNLVKIRGPGCVTINAGADGRVFGTGTRFGLYYNAGEQIGIGSIQFRTVVQVISDTEMVVSDHFDQVPLGQCLPFTRRGAKTTLSGWKIANDIEEHANNTTAYFNGGDLGFGRRMVASRRGEEVAYYVSNHFDVEDAANNEGRFATVAMEYSVTPGVNNDKPFTKFYVFGQDDVRITSADLDGEGAKYIPQLCLACHGSSRSYQLQPPDYGARFLPFDLDSFEYSLQPQYSRANQEPQFRFQNELILKTNATGAMKDLIQGWYPPGSTVQQADYVPQVWAGYDHFYLNLIKPSCRACHITHEGPSQTLLSPGRWLSSPIYFSRALCSTSKPMPNAKVTFDNFWDPNAATVQPDLFIDFTDAPVDCYPNSPLPDLSVESIELSNNPAAGQRTIFTITLDNLGTIRNVPPYSMSLEITGDGLGTLYTERVAGELQPGERLEHRFAFDFEQASAGVQHELRATIFYIGEELNTANNNRLVSFLVDHSVGPPNISVFSLAPGQFDKSFNGAVSFRYDLTVNQPIVQFRRRIQRVSDGQCIDPETGLVQSCIWNDWNVLSTQDQTAPFLYSYQGELNPYLSYADWQVDEYRIFTQGRSESGQWSNQIAVSIEIVDTATPLLSGFNLNPNQFDKSSSATVPFSYQLQSTQRISRFQRQIVRLIDQNCVAADTGQPVACQWDNWDVLQTTSVQAPFHYVYQGVLNPSVSYGTWMTGAYQLRVRGRNSAGAWSTPTTTGFNITETVTIPHISSFSLTPTSYDKAQSVSVPFAYSLVIDQAVAQFQRRIIRNLDGQCIDPETGLVANCSWRNWNVLSTTSGTAPYLYRYNGIVNPYFAYANWAVGGYTLHVQGRTSSGVWSNSRSLQFNINQSPLLSAFSLTPSVYSRSFNGPVNFQYQLTANQPITEFQRQFVRNADGLCIAPDTGQPMACSWLPWTVLTSSSSSAPYVYQHSGVLNPSVSYAGWANGTYTLRTRGRSGVGVWSDDVTLGFSITQ